MYGQSNPAGRQAGGRQAGRQAGRRQEPGPASQELTSGWKQPESVNYTGSIFDFT